MQCKICKSKTKQAFNHEIFNKYKIDYFICPNCEYLCTEDPYWLKETFEKDDIFDTGAIARNNWLIPLISVIIYNIFDKEGKYVDYAGGVGVFTRSMRDKGFDFYLYEKYRENCFAKGFEYKDDMKISGVTAFEIFEHLPDPIPEIKNILKISDNIIFTTDLKKELVPTDDWFYYSFPLGQHISFYSEKTFEVIAEQLSLHFYTFKGIHILCRKELDYKRFKKCIKKRKSNLKKITLTSKTMTDCLYLQQESKKQRK